MADYAAPSGPPPPKVPEGWIARWNDQYSEWFYVNKYTRKSQWEKPTEPIYGPPDDDHAAPSGAPPGYDNTSARPTGPEKGSRLSSNNPYGAPPDALGAGGSSGAHPDTSEDERLARQLQAEEESRAQHSRSHGSTGGGAADGYYSGGQGGSYPDQLPPRPGDAARGDGKRGLFSKLMGKSNRPPQQGGYGGGPQQPWSQQQQSAYYQGGPPPGGQYGGYPQQQPGGYYQQQPMGYQPQYAQQPPRRSGIGAGGAAALGVGGGLLGGVLLGEALDGGDGGGDYGGGDDGGGDYGGDGGGDGGGGD